MIFTVKFEGAPVLEQFVSCMVSPAIESESSLFFVPTQTQLSTLISAGKAVQPAYGVPAYQLQAGSTYGELVMGFCTGPFPQAGQTGELSYFMGQILNTGTLIEMPFRGKFNPGVSMEGCLYPYSNIIPNTQDNITADVPTTVFPHVAGGNGRQGVFLGVAAGTDTDTGSSTTGAYTTQSGGPYIFQLVSCSRNGYYETGVTGNNPYGVPPLDTYGRVTGLDPYDCRAWFRLVGSALQRGQSY
jgi:hypothetical protein